MEKLLTNTQATFNVESDKNLLCNKTVTSLPVSVFWVKTKTSIFSAASVSHIYKRFYETHPQHE